MALNTTFIKDPELKKKIDSMTEREQDAFAREQFKTRVKAVSDAAREQKEHAAEEKAKLEAEAAERAEKASIEQLVATLKKHGYRIEKA